MDWTYILGILGIAVNLYLIGSLRVLRQYERGVVFLLGKFEGVRGPGLTLIFVPIQQIRPLSAMSSDDSASISFSRTPRASTCRSRTSSTGTRSRGVPQ